jgi:hypothetical protein
MLFYIIAISLGYIILSANITIIIVVEALFHSISIVIKLILIYLTIPYQFYINNYISYFWICKFKDN